MSAEWVSVGALGDAFAPQSNAPPESAELVGRQLALHFGDGQVIEYAFTSATQLARKAAAGDVPEWVQGEAAYTATRVRPGFFLVHVVEPRRAAAATTVLLDLDTGACTRVESRLPTREEASRPFYERILAGEELTGVETTFVAGAIGKPLDDSVPRHAPTADLVGRRVEYTYSPTEKYEHIYLNERLYTWQCLAGVEVGLADTDRCHYLKLADDLYLFVWREKIVPTLGIVALDFAQQRTMGRIFGYSGFDFGAVTSFRMGAHVHEIGPARA